MLGALMDLAAKPLFVLARYVLILQITARIFHSHLSLHDRNPFTDRYIIALDYWERSGHCQEYSISSHFPALSLAQWPGWFSVLVGWKFAILCYQSTCMSINGVYDKRVIISTHLSNTDYFIFTHMTCVNKMNIFLSTVPLQTPRPQCRFLLSI